MKIKLCPECSEGFRRLSIALGVAGYLFLIQYYILEDIKHDFQYDMYWGWTLFVVGPAFFYLYSLSRGAPSATRPRIRL